MVVAVRLPVEVEVEGKHVVLRDPSPFLSEVLRSAVRADATSEPVVAVVVVAAEVIARWLPFPH